MAVTALAISSAYSASTEWSRMSAPRHEKGLTPLDDEQEDGYIVFGYCRDYANGVGQSGTIRAAIEIPAATAAQWKGNKLTKVRIGFGVTKRKDITVYLTEALNKASFYDQPATITTMDGWNEITLDTPYEIDGSKFFIGFEYANCTQGEYPVGIDDAPTNISLGDNIYSASTGWDHIGPMFGNVCIQAVISGDNLPQNDIEIVDVAIPSMVKPTQEFNTRLAIINDGSRNVSSLDIACTLDGEKLEGYTYSLNKMPLKPGESGIVTISGLKTGVEGIDMVLEVNVEKINGSADENPENNVATARVSSFNTGFKRNIVVEEWTGNWCGYCPVGIVGMSYMRDKYGDDGFIGIAVHGNNGYNQTDPMVVSSYQPFLNTWAIIGYPGSVINRSLTMYPNKENLEEAFLELSKTDTYATISELTASYNDQQPQNLDVSASTEFVLPLKEGGYSLAFVITENNFGPYYQSNYFSREPGELGGWENYPVSKLWYYDEVARNITDWNGIKGSVPQTVDPLTPAKYSTTLSLANVKALRRCELTALLLNDRTGEIVNASRMSLRETGVETNIAEENVKVIANNSGLEIFGEYAHAEVYATDGRIAATASGSNMVSLTGGVYIVKVTDLSGISHIFKVRV